MLGVYFEGLYTKIEGPSWICNSANRAFWLFSYSLDNIDVKRVMFRTGSEVSQAHWMPIKQDKHKDPTKTT